MDILNIFKQPLVLGGLVGVLLCYFAEDSIIPMLSQNKVAAYVLFGAGGAGAAAFFFRSFPGIL
jgi:hypothetical protein